MRVTCAAASKLSLPAWSALIVQVPAEANVSVPPDVTVHTPVVDEVKDGAKPDEAVAFNTAFVPKVGASGFTNVIVCDPFGVTAFDGADAVPIPAELVALPFGVATVTRLTPALAFPTVTRTVTWVWLAAVTVPVTFPSEKLTLVAPFRLVPLTRKPVTTSPASPDVLPPMSMPFTMLLLPPGARMPSPAPMAVPATIAVRYLCRLGMPCKSRGETSGSAASPSIANRQRHTMSIRSFLSMGYQNLACDLLLSRKSFVTRWVVFFRVQMTRSLRQSECELHVTSRLPSIESRGTVIPRSVSECLLFSRHEQRRGMTLLQNL